MQGTSRKSPLLVLLDTLPKPEIGQTSKAARKSRLTGFDKFFSWVKFIVAPKFCISRFRSGDGVCKKNEYL
ncbi:hypothetical protein D3Y55_08340 [Mesorhizobium sp. DCY119]|nr:hypothetical protein D3Y55_08340 [Mesorhizobium sp. DCY119]